MRPSDPATQSGLTLLSALTESEIDWILTAGETRKCEEGAVLVEEKSRPESIYLVLQGLLHIVIGGAGGAKVASLGPGQIVGEMSFLEERPASATVVAAEASEILVLPQTKLAGKLAADMGFSARLYRALAIVISDRLRDAVGQLARWLETQPVVRPDELERWQEVARMTQSFKERVIAAGKAAEDGATQVGRTLRDPLRHLSARLNKAIGDNSPESVDARDELGARVQRELLPYLLKSATVTRLYEKPRGYPGDFLTAEMIAANAPAGVSPAGPIVDDAFLALPGISAMRYLRALTGGEISREISESSTRPLKIAAIASAPAWELVEFVVADSTAVRAMVIEFDPQALDRMRLLTGGAGVEDALENLLTLALGRHHSAPGEHDLVYSLVFPATLADRFFIGLLNYIHSLLRPGGCTLIGCLHPSNPDKALLDHVLCWPLQHRTQQEVNALFQQSAFGRGCERFATDPDGVCHLAYCRKDPSSPTP